MPRRLESRTNTFPRFFPAFVSRTKTTRPHTARAVLPERSLKNKVWKRRAEKAPRWWWWWFRRVSSVSHWKTQPREIRPSVRAVPAILPRFLLGTSSYARAAEYANDLLHIHDFFNMANSWRGGKFNRGQSVLRCQRLKRRIKLNTAKRLMKIYCI